MAGIAGQRGRTQSWRCLMERRRIAYRDSLTGRFLTKKQFDRKDPATVERQKIRMGRPTRRRSR
jgi:hypothetical protein